VSKKEYYLQDGTTIYDLTTGEKLERTAEVLMKVRKGILIVWDDRETFQRKNKKLRLPYVYKTKKGREYLLSTSLTSSFLREVLYDYFECSAVVVEAPAGILCFYGKNQQYLISRDQQEKETFIQSFYQGIEPERIDIEKAVSLVLPKSYTKQIALAVAVGVLFGSGYFIYDLLFAPPPPPPPTAVQQQPPPPPTEFSEVGSSQKFLTALLKSRLGGYQLVKRIDFTSRTVNLLSAVPEKGFVKQGSWYEKKNVQLKRPQLTEVKVTKDFTYCYDLLIHKWKGKVLTVGEKSITVKLDGKVREDKAVELIRDLKGCPVSVKGEMSIDPTDLKNVQYQLTVVLYKMDTKAYNSSLPLYYEQY